MVLTSVLFDLYFQISITCTAPHRKTRCLIRDLLLYLRGDFSMEYVAFDYNEPTNQRWKEIMAEKLKTAATFKIHCWTEECGDL